MPVYTRPLKYVRDYPGNATTIVLLHGFLASKSYWSKIIPALRQDGSRVIAIDLLGFGNSPKPKHAPYDYANHLTHITTTLDALGLKAPITLIGHSMGALLSLRYAEIYPERINAVGLINPPMYLNPEQAYHTLRSTGYFYRLLLDSRYRHLLWILLRKFGPLANHSRYSREGSLTNVIMPATFFHDLRRLKQPTLLVVGKNDRRIYLDNLRSTQIGDNIQIFIEETGHHSPVTHPVRISQHILRLTAQKTARPL